MHGDLKSESVLIFDTGDGSKVVVKLADFGCAVMDLEPSDTMALPAFSPPWDAPESHDRLSRDGLQRTDVYSYGLLVWRVALDGASPFRRIDSLTFPDKAEFHRQVRILKTEDLVLPLARPTLKESFCSTQESHIIVDLLDHTLQLDASKRNLERSLELLREPSWPDLGPVEPLEQYEYSNVSL